MKNLPPPQKLRINLLSVPFGIRRHRLSLSWVMANTAGETNAYQSAYRVVVSEGRANAEAGRYVYDSGWVSSSSSSSVRPTGMADGLIADRLYYARVAIRDRQDGESAFTPPLGFTVASEVSARGIWAQEGDFALLRREFSLSEATYKESDRAVVTAAAVNPEPARQFAYTLYVNGEEVGVGASRLGKTPDGEEVIYTQSYDVTSLLRPGKNCIGAIGYALADKGFFCRLTVYGKDGLPCTVTDTDSDANVWQTLCGDAIYGKSNSIGTGYFTAHACNVDASIFPFGFSEVGFDTTHRHGRYGWVAPDGAVPLMGGLRLIPADTEPVRRYPTPAARVQTLPDGTHLIDLGAEIVGGLRWTVDAPHACTVTLTYGEQLTASGTVKCPMNTGNIYRETWTLKPGKQTIETLGMMAFRYVQMEGSPVAVTPDSLWGLELRKPFDGEASMLTSDSSLLRDLHRLTRHTMRVTSQDIYVDSQSRERGAYEGDLLINMLAAYAMEDSFAPARLTTEYLLGHRTWPADYLLMILFAAREDYMVTGDASLLSEWYGTLKANLFTDYTDETGLVRSPVMGASVTNAVLVDWPPSERDGYDMEAPYSTVFNALHVRAYGDMAQIAAVLEQDADAIEFSLRADRLRHIMINRLYDTETGRFRDGMREDGTVSAHAAQHATAFCLSCGVYTDRDMADRMAKALNADGKIRMSVYGAFFLLEGLYKTGNGGIANRLMLDSDATEGVRTWAYMLYGLGATVTSEAWNQRNKPNMTLSHPWGAAPAHMISAGVFGVTPTSPAFETFDVRVCPEGLREASVKVPTIRGPIVVSFRNCPEGFALTVSVPANTTATVYLPDGRGKTVGSGEWGFRTEGLSVES